MKGTGSMQALALALTLLVALAACDATSSAHAPDATPDGIGDAMGDATSDAGADAAPDTGRDAAPAADTAADTATDTGADTGADAGADAGADTGADAGADTATTGDIAAPPTGPYRNVLATAADFAALAVEGELKYLAPVAGRAAPAPLDGAECWFQDMHVEEWHLQFLRSFAELRDLQFEDYVTMVVDPDRRLLWGGALAAYPSVRHPVSQQRGIYAYTLYTDQDRPDGMTVDDVVAVHAILERCAPFAGELLVFLVHGAGQKQFMAAAGPALDERGIPWLMPEALVAGQPFVPYSEGEGYGTLRIVPPGAALTPDGYGPRDVVVVESAPNDIGIVQGLVTADPQNVHSHVNLRLTEKGVPNAALPDVYENALVASLDGALVHLVVAADGVTFEPARLADAEAFWAAHRPDVGAVRSDLSRIEMAGFDALRAADATAYGAKAANLGELFHALPPQNRVAGFGIPLAWYDEFVAANALGDAIRALTDDPRMDEDRTWRTEALASLRRSLRRGRLPDGFEEALHARLREVFGEGVETTRVRFRSSTNAEDLRAFSGAGLYDSRSGCLADDLDGDDVGPSRCLHADERAYLQAELERRRAELQAHPERAWLADLVADIEGDLADEKPVADAVRKVWASLWNDRAWEERAYYGIDHRAVFMGLAVNEAFVLEQVNAVAVTQLAAAEGADPLYRVVSQLGEWSVVQPEDPQAIPEVLTFRRTGDPPAMADVQVIVPSALAPPGEQVWPAAALEELAGALFALQDHFAAAVYTDVDPLSLDCEAKLTRDGRVVVKQARPYHPYGGQTF